MDRSITDGNVVINYETAGGVVVKTPVTAAYDIDSYYDVSDKATYYPALLTGIDGLPYEYVSTSADSVANKGSYTVADQTITHTYRIVKQVGSVTYRDITNTASPITLGAVDSLEGDSGSLINYNTAARINAYLQAGYELVSDGFPQGEKFDLDSTKSQDFVVTLRQRIVDVTPANTPGTVLDNTDPNSPVWLDTVGDKLVVTESVTRTITYKYAAGVTGNAADLPAAKTDTLDFSRKAKVNLVTGEVLYDS